MTGFYLIIIIFTLFGMYVSNKLKNKFNYYSKVSIHNNMTGKEIAEKMLKDNNIHDVKVISTKGELSDHYNPINKTVNLSEEVYYHRTVAAAAVAAHECGHAIQHKIGYSMLSIRSKMVPIVNIASKLNQFILFLGISIAATSNNTSMLWLGILLFSLTTIFTIITLPVEYDASNRALKWFKNNSLLLQKEYLAAKDALKWAARTYLVAALSSFTQLIYFILLALNNRRD